MFCCWHRNNLSNSTVCVVRLRTKWPNGRNFFEATSPTGWYLSELYSAAGNRQHCHYINRSRITIVYGWFIPAHSLEAATIVCEDKGSWREVWGKVVSVVLSSPLYRSTSCPASKKVTMNSLMRKTFRRLPIVVSDFMSSIFPRFPTPMMEYQLAGHCRPNYAEDDNESPHSVFDEIILRMAAPKSKVRTQIHENKS